MAINQLSTSNTFSQWRQPLGGGGRHLANLISLDDTVSPCLPSIKTKQQWISLLYTHYQNIGIHTHFAESLIISDPKWPSTLDDFASDLSNVHTGHAASFDWVKSTLDKLDNKRYILLTFNTDRSRQILKQREKIIFKSETLNNGYYIEELCHLYNCWFKDSKLCDDDINCAIEVQDIFAETIDSVIHKINHHFKLQIPIKHAQELHNLWFAKQPCNV